MRALLLIVLVAGCVPKAEVRPEARCDLPPLPAWQPVSVQPQQDGSALLAPTEAATMAANVRALRAWAAQAAACGHRAVQ